jgi:eukaryotic-like serine/threonine-protein kinase
MTIDARALAVVEEALDVADPRQRALFITRQCGDDADLYLAVQRILAMDQTGSPMLPTGASLVTSAEPEQPEVIPDRMGPFRIIDVIGRGGMGSVVRAERDDGVFSQTVAIKLIRADLADNAARERFLQERRILGQLVHPAIARILDGGEQDGRPYLVMDYVDGVPVTRALRHGRFGLNAILDMFESVCGAVAYAHRNLIVHADIKPSNVLATEEGAIKLVDFGIARLIDELEPEAASIAYPLTPGYAAPERTAGGHPTIAGDVYSLGVLLHEMLTGAMPTATARMSESADHDRVPARALLGDLDAIVARALAHDPAQRYLDVAALMGDIRRYRAHVPVAAREGEGWRYASGKFVRRHRRGIAITSAVIALLLTAVIVSTSLYVAAERERREADARFSDARGTARYLLFTLMPRLEQRPGALPLRAEVAGVAQHYLDRLSHAQRTSDAVRLEAAQGLWRLAEFQGKAGRPNLGQIQQADANLRRAEKLAAQLSGPGARSLLAHVRLDRSLLAIDMNADPVEADRILQEAERSVAAASVEEPNLHFDLLAATASLRIWQGRYAQAEAAARAALAQLPPRDDAREDRDTLVIRTRLTDNLAEALYYSHSAAQALPLYEAQMAMLEVAHRRWPQDNFMLLRLARARWNVTTTQMELGCFAAAAPLLAQGQREAEQGLAFDRTDLEAARLLRIVATAHAQGLAHLGRIDEALDIFASVIKTDEARWRANPANARAARDYVYDHTVVGESLDAVGRKVQACAADRRTLALYEMLGKRRLLQQLDLDHNLKLVHERISRNCAS